MSQHESIRTLIEDVVRSLRDDITFSYSRQTDFNSLSNKNNVCVHLDPLRWNPIIVDNSIHKAWSVALLFYKQGKKDDTEKQFVPILDDTAELVERFFSKLNRFEEDEDATEPIRTDNTSISSPSAEPAIKVTADCLTGWIVTFTFTAPDTFEYCSIYDS